MATALLPDAASVPAAAGSRPRRWAVVSPAFDLAFFTLPPLGTALCLLLLWAAPGARFALCVAVWVLLAQSHFGATLFFYLDPVSRALYRRRPWVYFVVPVALIAGYTALGFTTLAELALLALPLGSFWHGNKQSVGVAGLYRGLSGDFDRVTRTLEMAAIFAGSACFTAVGILRLGLLEPLGLRSSDVPGSAALAWWAALAVAAALLLATLVVAWKQCRRAGIRPWLRLSILTSSWAMYLPYTLAPDMLSAYLASLVPHYLQYHGLLYLVNRNKAGAGALEPGSLVGRLVETPRRYAGATVGFALLLGSFLTAAHLAGRTELGLCLVAGVNLAHFWLDGFFWRFRDPVARERTLRFIRPPSTIPAGSHAPSGTA